MSYLIPEDTYIEFQAGPGWTWYLFDGCIKLTASLQRFIHEGKAIVIDTDLFTCVTKLLSKAYKADLYPSLPGSVLSATLRIDSGTLCDRVLIEGHQAVKLDTTGTFEITCSPSILTGETPKPDPNPTHQGTWRIRSTPNPRTQC
jgi:hypothetical protein